MFAKSYAKYYDLFNQDKPYKKEIKFIYEWADRPNLIFDIGCGTGSYWKYYPKEVSLYGVEKSIAMQRFSNDRGIIVCEDIREYKKSGVDYDCATALFDVINYIPSHEWWRNIPIDTGKYFVFDLWDTEKIKRQGFRDTLKVKGNIKRQIIPIVKNQREVILNIVIDDGKKIYEERHKMYLYSTKDIERFCGNDFEIVEVKPTKKWQVWYLLRRR